MRDAEFVGGSGFAGFDSRLVDGAFESIFGAFEIPEED